MAGERRMTGAMSARRCSMKRTPAAEMLNENPRRRYYGSITTSGLYPPWQPNCGTDG